MSEMTVRNKKMMLAGLFLSKFDKVGYEALGYKTWTEAFEGLAAVVGGPATSIKNYRDEFDPVFNTPRQGWRNRAMHPTRKIFLDEFGKLGIDEFLGLVQTQFATDADIDLAINKVSVAAGLRDTTKSFAKRMMTGRGAENYFEMHYTDVDRFSPCEVKRTTDLGCGFDFKLTPPHEDFLGVEVKGVREKQGQIHLTEKEHKMALSLKKRFYLYVVTNFASAPIPQVIEDPLHSGITFELKTSNVETKVWTANIKVVA